MNQPRISTTQTAYQKGIINELRELADRLEQGEALALARIQTSNNQLRECFYSITYSKMGERDD